MARILMATQGWGVLWDAAGNVQVGVNVQVRNRDGTNATHYSARTGGTSATTAIVTDSRGRLMRFIDPGEYTITYNSETYDIEAANASLAGSFVARANRPVHVKDQVGFVGDGSTSDATAYADALSALPPRGGTLALPTGFSVPGTAMNAIQLSGVQIIGEGFSCSANAAMGDSQWSDPAAYGGTVLKFTNTSGEAIRLSHTVSRSGVRLQDFMVLGPGSGTSSAIRLGNTGIPEVGSQHGIFENVITANFSVGWDIRFTQDSTFIRPQSRGCSTGIKITEISNQNVFINPEVQFSTADGIYLSASAVNTFYGGLLQNCNGTAALRVFDNNNNTFDGFYCEGGTATRSVNIAGTRHVLTNWHFSADTHNGILTAGFQHTLRNMALNDAAAPVTVGSSDTILENVGGTVTNSGSRNIIISNGQIVLPATGPSSGPVLKTGGGPVQIGTDAFPVKSLFPYSQSVDLPSQAANSTTELNVSSVGITFTGTLAYHVFLGAPGLPHGLEVMGYPATNGDLIRLRVSNHTASAIDATSLTMHFLVIKI